MGEINITGKDIGLAAAALALLVLAVIVLILVLIMGSPVALLGIILGLGIVGLLALGALLVFIISVWYVLYALLKGMFSKEEEPQKGSYTINRLKKS